MSLTLPQPDPGRITGVFSVPRAVPIERPRAWIPGSLGPWLALSGSLLAVTAVLLSWTPAVWLSCTVVLAGAFAAATRALPSGPLAARAAER